MLALAVAVLISAEPASLENDAVSNAPDAGEWVPELSHELLSEPSSEAQQPAPEPRTSPARWFPLQGNATGTGMIAPGGAGTLGISLYVGYAHGSANRAETWLSNREGLFWGVGGIAFFGNTDISECFGALRCAARRWGGVAARLGYGFYHHVEVFEDRAPSYWPDTYVYAQLGGFLGAEAVPSAPLAPGLNAGLRGLRLEFGVTSIAFSRFLAGLWGDLVTKSNDARTVIFAVLLLPLILLNHAELQVEVSNSALSNGGVRFGFALGSGF